MSRGANESQHQAGLEPALSRRAVPSHILSSPHTLELGLLDEAALVLVEDLEDLFDLLGGL